MEKESQLELTTKDYVVVLYGIVDMEKEIVQKTERRLVD